MSSRARREGEYWEKHVLSWEEGAYPDSAGGSAHVGLLDRLSTHFRGTYVQDRMAAAADFLAPNLPGLTVLDVGCASGRFALRLLELGAHRVTGIDVAAAAVEAAHRRATAVAGDQLEFHQADVTAPDVQLPRVDLVTALGVLEYLDAPSLAAFLGKVRARYFLFDLLLMREVSTLRLLWPLRTLYLRAKSCPGVYMHSVQEIADLAARAGLDGGHQARCRGFYFATNLPGGDG